VQGCMQAAAITLDCIVTVHYCGVFVVGRMQVCLFGIGPALASICPTACSCIRRFVPNNSSQTLAVGVSPFLVSFVFRRPKKAGAREEEGGRRGRKGGNGKGKRGKGRGDGRAVLP
jgi:hypothetical protein